MVYWKYSAPYEQSLSLSASHITLNALLCNGKTPGSEKNKNPKGSIGGYLVLQHGTNLAP